MPLSRELVQRQRRAAERLRREVAGADGSRGHPYFRDLRRLRSFRRVVEPETIFRACRRAGIVYVGDYHAVPEYQRFAARLLRETAREPHPLGLGIEFLYTRQQPVLDLRQQGRLGDDEFLRRVHYHEEWGHPWEGFRDLLDTARELGVEVFALDAPPRGGYDQASRRDHHGARRIVSLIEDFPDMRLMVLFGESHLTPTHLPGKVRSALSAAGIGRADVVVFQSPDALYWKLVEGGQLPLSPVEIDARTYAVFHTGPLEKYEAYRQVLEQWASDEPGMEEVDLTPAVHHLIHTLLDWLGLDARRCRLQHRAGWAEELEDALPEVYSGAEADALLGRILAEHGRTAEELDEARRLLAERGALYEPRSNALFLVRYLPGPAAGEAARFLRAALTGRLFIVVDDFRGDATAQMYGAALNEALAELGARLIDPAVGLRPRPARPERDAGEGTEIRDWVEAHRRFERSRRLRPPEPMVRALAGSRSLRRALARDLGERLGLELFERVRHGTLGPRQLRNLFSRPLLAERAPATVLRLLRGQKKSRAR